VQDPVKSGSTPVGGPVKSGRKQTKDKGRGLDNKLVRLGLVTAWIQRLRTTSVFFFFFKLEFIVLRGDTPHIALYYL